jgi:predicted  nucleic acid-binding Zn ribbon protein
MPDREPEPWESGAAGPFRWIETAHGTSCSPAGNGEALSPSNLYRDALKAPREEANLA